MQPAQTLHIYKENDYILFLYKNNFIKRIALILAKKVKKKLRTKPNLLSHRTYQQNVFNKGIVRYGFHKELKSLKSST